MKIPYFFELIWSCKWDWSWCHYTDIYIYPSYKKNKTKQKQKQKNNRWGVQCPFILQPPVSLQFCHSIYLHNFQRQTKITTNTINRVPSTQFLHLSENFLSSIVLKSCRNKQAIFSNESKIFRYSDFAEIIRFFQDSVMS